MLGWVDRFCDTPCVRAAVAPAVDGVFGAQTVGISVHICDLCLTGGPSGDRSCVTL